jgi:hypothetical protein
MDGERRSGDGRTNVGFVEVGQGLREIGLGRVDVAPGDEHISLLIETAGAIAGELGLGPLHLVRRLVTRGTALVIVLLGREAALAQSLQRSNSRMAFW